MKHLLLIPSALLIVSCASAPVEVPPPAATPIIGCTAPITLPVCSLQRSRPVFEKGDSAVAVAEAYEIVKGELQKSERCISDMRAAVDQYRISCGDKLND